MPARHLITAEALVPQLESTIGYAFKNTSIGWEVLQCAGSFGYAEGNKRLALIGDAVLKLKVVVKWYPTKTTRGTADRLIQQHTRNDALTKLGKEIGLENLIVTNPSQWQVGVSPSQIADCMEAIIGAVYVDGGEKCLDGVFASLGFEF